MNIGQAFHGKLRPANRAHPGDAGSDVRYLSRCEPEVRSRFKLRIIPNIDSSGTCARLPSAMSMGEKKTFNARLSERLTTSGFRFTPQREHVYSVLLQKRDHPTAEEVFIRAKREIPDISMATVYNCLDALVKCGLV